MMIIVIKIAMSFGKMAEAEHLLKMNAGDFATSVKCMTLWRDFYVAKGGKKCNSKLSESADNPRMGR
jgi:hypothetical protein